MNKRALISVWDKVGIVEFSKLLVERGYEILSTGGTKNLLEKNGIEVKSVSDLTGFGSIMDGRVKTLHPKIFGGILADRKKNSHIEDLKKIESGVIDLVVVNLYPFVEEAVNKKLSLDKAIEFIDIGGPSMLRASAKNHQSVIPICDPQDYMPFIKELDESNGEISIDLRKKYAIKVFTLTTNYDSEILSYFSSLDNEDELPSNINVNVEKNSLLRYGENPHQQAAFYKKLNSKNSWSKLQGKELSFNNYTDIESAFSIVNDFEDTACSIIKHANPCGFAIGENSLDAFNKAVSSDPVSYFGGIIGFNRTVGSDLANKLIEPFLECIVAPDFDEDSLEIFKNKKNLRLIKTHENFKLSKIMIKNALGGFLVQDRDELNFDIQNSDIATKKEPTQNEFRALVLGWKLVKYVKSNAIVFSNENQILSVGAGQMSRVDSVKNAIRKISETGLSLKGAVMASDAFFPFPDCIEIAAKAGVTSIIQPGGSIKDSEVIAVADELNLSMVLTKKRHFYH